MSEEVDDRSGKSRMAGTSKGIGVEEDMDEHRVLVNKIRKRVYENVLVRFIQARHQFAISDIVDEPTIPNTE